jgi:hypothetical protein
VTVVRTLRKVSEARVCDEFADITVPKQSRVVAVGEQQPAFGVDAVGAGLFPGLTGRLDLEQAPAAHLEAERIDTYLILDVG